MTLRATIELVPFGVEQNKRTLFTLNISNISHTEEREPGMEDLYVIEVNDYKNVTDATARVRHYREDGAAVLVLRALEEVRGRPVSYFYYMPMPINADGDGPCEEHEAVKTLHEVWDEDFFKICECPDKESAQSIAWALNFYEKHTKD